jgi:hypothetical protein
VKTHLHVVDDAGFGGKTVERFQLDLGQRGEHAAVIGLDRRLAVQIQPPSRHFQDDVIGIKVHHRRRIARLILDMLRRHRQIARNHLVSAVHHLHHLLHCRHLLSQPPADRRYRQLFCLMT